jgi:hypothetical protein
MFHNKSCGKNLRLRSRRSRRNSQKKMDIGALVNESSPSLPLSMHNNESANCHSIPLRREVLIPHTALTLRSLLHQQPPTPPFSHKHIHTNPLIRER